MTIDDLPEPPPNTRWLLPDEIITAGCVCVRGGLISPPSLDTVGVEAGDPFEVAGGWMHHAAPIVMEPEP